MKPANIFYLFFSFSFLSLICLHLYTNIASTAQLYHRLVTSSISPIFPLFDNNFIRNGAQQGRIIRKLKFRGIITHIIKGRNPKAKDLKTRQVQNPKKSSNQHLDDPIPSGLIGRLKLRLEDPIQQLGWRLGRLLDRLRNRSRYPYQDASLPKDQPLSWYPRHRSEESSGVEPNGPQGEISRGV